MLDVNTDLGLVGAGTVIASEQKRKKEKKKDVREQFKRSAAPDPRRKGQ